MLSWIVCSCLTVNGSCFLLWQLLIMEWMMMLALSSFSFSSPFSNIIFWRLLKKKYVWKFHRLLFWELNWKKKGLSSLSSYFYQKSFSHKASIFPYFQAAEKSQHAKLYRYWQIISTNLHNCHILITFVQIIQNKSSYPDDFLQYYKSNPTFCSLEKKY